MRSKKGNNASKFMNFKEHLGSKKKVGLSSRKMISQFGIGHNTKRMIDRVYKNKKGNGNGVQQSVKMKTEPLRKLR